MTDFRLRVTQKKKELARFVEQERGNRPQSQTKGNSVMESDSDRSEGKVSDIRVPVALNTLQKERMILSAQSRESCLNFSNGLITTPSSLLAFFLQLLGPSW